MAGKEPEAGEKRAGGGLSTRGACSVAHEYRWAPLILIAFLPMAGNAETVIDTINDQQERPESEAALCAMH